MLRAMMLVMLSVAGACYGAGPNLLVNPGFDGEVGQEDFGWGIRHGAGAEVVEVVVDRDVTHEGAASVRITQTRPVYSAISQYFDTRPRAIYAIEVWIRATDVVSTGRGPVLFVGNEKANTVTAQGIRDYESDGTWRKLTCVVNSGEREKMCLVPMANDCSGTVWFSQPSVREVSAEEAGELLGRNHGFVFVASEPDTSFAWFGRDVAHICREFPSVVWLSRALNFDDAAAANLSLIVDLPLGVEVAGGYRGWKIESVTEGDRTRVTLSGSAAKYCPLYLTTTWQPGRDGTAQVWAQWDGGRQSPPHSFGLRCIAIPRARQPKRLIAGLSGPPLSGLYPGDFVATAKHMGFNTVNLWTAGAWADKPDEGLIPQVAEYTRAGFWVSANHSPMHHADYKEALKATEDAQACTIAGARSAGMPCPSYRGELYEGLGREISNLALSGISYAHLDEEIWNGHGLCFCERCLARWEGYRAEHYPDLPELSPVEFEANPAGHMALHEAWVRFKCHMVTEMFAGWSQVFAERSAETGAKSSPVPWFDSWLAVSPRLADRYYYMHDPADLTAAFNHQVPMIYDTADVVRGELAGLVAVAGREKIVAGLTAGEPSVGRQLFPPEEARAQALEAAFAPTMGYVLWTYHRSDVGTLAALARVHDIMARAEDVLLDGRSTKRLQVVSGQADVSGFELAGDRLIAFVRQYDEPGEMALEMAGSARWLITDMDSGAQVARITGDAREFGLDLAGANTRVLECIRQP